MSNSEEQTLGASQTLLIAPDRYRISQSFGLHRIQTVARPPIWLNMFLFAWFIPWTGFTMHLCASYFDFIEPMDFEGSLFGNMLGFSFFWLIAFLVIVFINFYVMETRFNKNQLENRFGVPGFVLKTTIDKSSIENVVIVKRNAYVDDSGERNEARWELCIDGKIGKTLVVLGVVTLTPWSPTTTRFTVDSAWTVAELQWFAFIVTNWSGKAIQMS